MHVFSRVFETIEKFAGRCYRGFLKLFKTLAARVLSGFKNTRLRLVFLNPIKHCCSCFKQYLKTKENFKLLALKVVVVAYKKWLLKGGFKYSDFTWKLQ